MLQNFWETLYVSNRQGILFVFYCLSFLFFSSRCLLFTAELLNIPYSTSTRNSKSKSPRRLDPSPESCGARAWTGKGQYLIGLTSIQADIFHYHKQSYICIYCTYVRSLQMKCLSRIRPTFSFLLAGAMSKNRYMRLQLW